MKQASVWATSLFALALLPHCGCAASWNTEYRSADEIFVEATVAVLDFLSSVGHEDWRDKDRKTLEARRKWQRENLSDSELRELGVSR